MAPTTRAGLAVATFLALGCFLASTADAAVTTCQVSVGGYSSYFGNRESDARLVDQTQKVAYGRITQVTIYSTPTCVVGFRVQYGTDAANTYQLGASKGSKVVNTTAALAVGEFINKVDVRNSSTCVESVSFTTTKGNKIAAGNAASKAAAKTSTPSAVDGLLLALRGYETPPAEGSKLKGPLQQLGFVWGRKECGPPGAPAPSGTPSKDFAVASSSPTPAAPTPGPKASPSSSNEIPKVPFIKCPAIPRQCNASADAQEFTACSFLAPFKQPKCWGGCCSSAGKCASSVCAISGLGRDVSSIICYGINSGLSFGGSNVCAGLACKLKVPGCTTDTFGGNCVGAVVALAPASKLDPVAAKYLGYPCLDAMPSETTLNSKGMTATNGAYVSKLWTICDCLDPVVASSTDNSGDAGSGSGSKDVQPVLPTPGDFIGKLLNRTNADKNDILKQLAKILPKQERKSVNFDSIIPQVNLSGVIKLPEMPKLTIPEFNITLPKDLFPELTTKMDINNVLNLLGGDKVTGLATLLQGLGGGDEASPLTSLGKLILAARQKNDTWGALTTFMQTLPKDIATPDGIKNFLTSLETNPDGSAGPLKQVVDYLKTLPPPKAGSADSATGNRITDIISNMQGASGSGNRLGSFLDMLSALPTPEGSTGSPLGALTNLISALPGGKNVTDAGALSKLGDLLSIIPKPDGSGASAGNPLSGLSSFLSALPLQDKEGNNPLGPLADLVGSIAEGVKGAGAGSDNAGPGSALSNLFSAITSLGGKDTTATDVDTSSNPITSFLSKLASGDGTNPLQSVLEALPKPGDVTATDGAGFLGTLVNGIASHLPDTSSPNPLASFLEGLTSAANSASDDSSTPKNPLSSLLGAVGDAVANSGDGSNPLAALLSTIGSGDGGDGSSNPILDLLSKVGDAVSSGGSGDGGSNPIADLLSKVGDAISSGGSGDGGSNPIADLLSSITSGDSSADPSAVLGLLSVLGSAAAEHGSDGSDPLASILQAIQSAGDGQFSAGSPMALLSSLAQAAGGSSSNGDGSNPVLDLLSTIGNAVASHASSDGSDPLSGLLSALSGASNGDGSSDPSSVLNLLSTIGSAVAPKATDTSASNPLSGLLSVIGGGSSDGSGSGINPLLGGVLSAVGAKAAESSNPLVSFLGGLASKVGGGSQ